MARLSGRRADGAPRGVIGRVAAEIRRLAPPGPAEPAMAPMVEAMRSGGLLAACSPRECGGRGLAHHPQEPEEAVETMAAVGAADLSAARLFEGHVNAVKLVVLYGGAERPRWLADVTAGRLFGVWGAEGRDPVRLANGRLEGQKLYASGSDVVERPIVTARDEDGRQRLIVLDADRLDGRLHPGEWSTTGMRATASGRCDLDGVPVAPQDMLGDPDVYLAEPHFRGGVWRYAAAHLGAMRAMTRETSAALAARGQDDAPLQVERLRRMVMACETGRLWILRAATEVERPGARPEAAAVAILARLAVAHEARALIAAMDDALGAASFATAHPVERRRRDLTFYLRQAAPDAMGQAALDMLRGDACRARAWNLT